VALAAKCRQAAGRVGVARAAADGIAVTGSVPVPGQLAAVVHRVGGAPAAVDSGELVAAAIEHQRVLHLVAWRGPPGAGADGARPGRQICRQDVITAGFPSLQTLVILRCVNRQPSGVRRSRSS
jgi:hypothetical protein